MLIEGLSMDKDFHIVDLSKNKNYKVPGAFDYNSDGQMDMDGLKDWARNHNLNVRSVFVYDNHLIDKSKYDLNNNNKLEPFEVRLYCSENDFKLRNDATLKVDFDNLAIKGKIDAEIYGEKELRNRFPAAYYEYIVDEEPYSGRTNTQILNMATGSPVLEILREADGRVLRLAKPVDYSDEYEILDFDKNGILLTRTIGENTVFSNESAEYVEQLVDELQNAVKEEDNIGLPVFSPSVKYRKAVEKISYTNVLKVLDKYKENNNGKSLVATILGNTSIKFEERREMVNHIMSQLSELYQYNGVYVSDIQADFEKELEYQDGKLMPASAERVDSLVNKLHKRYEGVNLDLTENSLPNGKLDKTFKQARTGDCWLLAAIKAISLSPKGKEILENSIKVASNGDVTVTLQGPKRSYTFSEKEILANAQLSHGDLDVRALEMAVDRYFAEERGVQGKVDLDGNWMFVAYEILTGKGGCDHFFSFGSRADILINPDYYDKQISDEDIDNFNKPNHIATVSSHLNKGRKKLKTKDGVQFELLQDHAYSVSHADSKFVYLINPWNTSVEFPVPRELFKEYFNYLQEFDL